MATKSIRMIVLSINHKGKNRTSKRGDCYAGDSNTIFGRLRDNRMVFMEVGYAFEVGSKL
jgi:hypothetical protein